MVAARAGLVGEYARMAGQEGGGRHRSRGKARVHAVVQRLLPGAQISGPAAADTLAVAITAHHLASAARQPGPRSGRRPSALRSFFNRAALDEIEDIRIDQIQDGCAHAVRQVLVGLERAVPQRLGRQLRSA